MEDIFFFNEASPEMLSAATEQCKRVGIRSDNVRLLQKGKWEGWQKKKEGAVDHLLLFSLPWVSFLPRMERKYLNLFRARSCVCCSPVVSLPCYFHWRYSTHGISHTKRHPPQSYICTHISPETDAQTLFKYIHRNTTEICIQYLHKHSTRVQTHNICHISLKATAKLNFREYIYHTFSCIDKD